MVVFSVPRWTSRDASLGAGVILAGMADVYQITLGQYEKGKGT